MLVRRLKSCLSQFESAHVGRCLPSLWHTGVEEARHRGQFRGARRGLVLPVHCKHPITQRLSLGLAQSPLTSLPVGLEEGSRLWKWQPEG
jgi:hypothetical protein